MTYQQTDDNANSKVFLVRNALAENHQLDPDSLYCLFTGKPIATSDPDDIDSLINSLIDSDPADAADDLAIRILASSRPSIRWNRLRVESLGQLRKSHPHETLSYLLCRLMDSQPTSDFFEQMAFRVKTYRLILNLPMTEINASLDLLIEMDARVNLLTFNSKLALVQITNSLRNQTLADTLEPCALIARRDYESARASANYLRGNPMAKRAHFDAFMASKPQSASAAKKRTRDSDFAFMDSVFSALVDSPKPSTPILNKALEKQAIVESTRQSFISPAFHPVTPRKFGVKS